MALEKGQGRSLPPAAFGNRGLDRELEQIRNQSCHRITIWLISWWLHLLDFFSRFERIWGWWSKARWDEWKSAVAAALWMTQKIGFTLFPTLTLLSPSPPLSMLPQFQTDTRQKTHFPTSFKTKEQNHEKRIEKTRGSLADAISF